MASRLIFNTICLSSPMFSKKYENLSWKTITTRAQKRIEQEKAKNSNRNEAQEKLDENFSSKPLLKKPRSRPRKNLLTNLKNISSQTTRKRGRPRKQIYEDELPEIYMQKASGTKVESDSDSDLDYLDYMKLTQANNKKKKNAKKPKNINEFESENYFSTSEDEINDIETSHEGNDGENYEENWKENFQDDLEDDFEKNFEQNFEENFEDNLEENFEEKFEENLEEKLEEEFEEPYFEENLRLNRRSQITTNGTPRDNGSKTLERRKTLPKFENLQKGIAKKVKKWNYYHFALPIEVETKANLSETLNNIKLSIHSLHELSQ